MNLQTSVQTPPEETPQPVPDTIVNSQQTGPMQQKAGFVFRAAAMIADQFVMGILGALLGVVAVIFKTPINLMYSVVGVLSFLYYWLSTGLMGATLGKRLFKMTVVTKEGNVSLGKALLRETVGKIFSSIPFSLGYFWVLWDKDKQAWHDKIAGTYVVQESIGGLRKAFAYILVLIVPILMVLAIIGIVLVLAINPQEQIQKAKLYEMQQNLPSQ